MHLFCKSAYVKRVCDFLLVHHSNLGPILHRFRDIADFFAPQPFSTLILVMFLLDQIADVGVSPIIYHKLITVKLFSKYSNLCDHGT